MCYGFEIVHYGIEPDGASRPYDGLRMRAGWMTQEELAERAKETGRVGEIFRGITSLR